MNIRSVACYAMEGIGLDYKLCVYDDGALVANHEIAAGGVCNGNPCWKPVGSKGFLYKNPTGNDDGITKLLLKAGTGNAKILLKGSGTDLGLPASDPMFTQNSELTVQLIASTGSCWEAVYPAPATSIGTDFKDKIPD